MKLKDYIYLDKFKHLSKLPDWLKNMGPYYSQIGAIREFLGMTKKQLGMRAGAKGDRVIRRLEGRETSPNLATLEKVAEALGCELIVNFIPKKPLEEILTEQATQKAKELVAMSRRNAAMEKQEPAEKIVERQIKNLAEELIRTKRSSLWEK